MYFTFRKLRKRYLKMVKRYESQSRITTRNWLFSFTIRLHWAERTFYWHFVLSLRNLRLEILKSFDLDFTGQKPLVFLFFIFSLWWLSNHFYWRSYKKNNHFLNEYQKYSFFLHFHKDLTSRNFWQWNDGLL